MYCIDTSALIAAWSERYPIDNFPRFWDALNALIQEGKCFAPHPVFVEIEKKSDELHAWLKTRADMFIPLDEAIQLRAKAVLVKYPRLVGQLKQRTAADTFVIAAAVERSLIVVTEESYTDSVDRPRIPTVCADPEFKCECIKLLGLIQREKWVIG